MLIAILLSSSRTHSARMRNLDQHPYSSQEETKQMNTNRQTAIIEGDKQMNSKGSTLIRWAGLAAVAAGVIFAGIQPIHPADVLSSVTTEFWAIITPLKTVMAFLFLLGLTGLYA